MASVSDEKPSASRVFGQLTGESASLTSEDAGPALLQMMREAGLSMDNVPAFSAAELAAMQSQFATPVAWTPAPTLSNEDRMREVVDLLRELVNRGDHKSVTGPTNSTLAKQNERSRKRVSSRPGRKRIYVDYSEAARTYWALRYEFEEAREPRRPSIRDVTDRLSVAGLTVSTRTFGDRCQEWRDAGLPWPPARPDDE